MSNLQALVNNVHSLPEMLVLAVEEVNDTIRENNELIDELQEKDKALEQAEATILRLQEMNNQQLLVVKTSVEVKKKDIAQIKLLQAQVNEYRKMDPKRLEKLNKRYKDDIKNLKEKVANSEQARKKAIAENKKISQMALDQGLAAIYHNPDNGNAIRLVPNIFVGKDNDIEGVVGSPVLEFMHHTSGTSRQGVLNLEGGMSWASHENTLPSEEETLVAKDWIKRFCKINKIKT